MAFQRSQSAGYLANNLARLFAARLAEAVGPLGLAPAQFMTLLALWEGDGLTQSELTARLDVEQATMANTLSRMERDGLVRRLPHPEDRRAQQVWLTGRAKALETPAKNAADAVNQAALSTFTSSETAMLLTLMERAIATLRSVKA